MPETAIAILGPGLIGGSLLHDGRRLGWKMHAWTRRADIAARIRQQNLAALATTDLAEALRGVSLAVLTTPVESYADLAQQIIASEPGEDFVVTDAGSVKGAVLSGVGKILQEAGIAFVGSHPMAGSHEKGLEAAKAHLFADAACLVTPEPDTDRLALRRVKEFWSALGGRVTEMDAITHDAVVARVSHMPHMAAVAVTLAALQADPSIGAFAAGGLRDTTRVASGDTGMWHGILTANRAAVLRVGRELQAQLGELLEILENLEDQALLSRLAAAKSLRDSRYPHSGGGNP